MTNKFKVAALQTKVYQTEEENLRELERLMNAEEAADADLITLPEMFNCPYEVENFPEYAEPEGGRCWQKCSELAAEHHVYLSAGTMPESDEEGHVYNTAYVFDREGHQIGKARKAHLFDINIKNGQSFRESDTLTAGDWIETFDTEMCRMGICVCFDFRFPEMGRIMAQDGAKVILCPAAFNMTTGPAHWELMFRQRAVEDQCWVIGTAPSRDSDGSYVSWGHTIIADPWGRAVSQADEKQQIVTGEIDLDLVDKIRHQLPLLSARRTDMYQLSRIEQKKED